MCASDNLVRLHLTYFTIFYLPNTHNFSIKYFSVKSTKRQPDPFKTGIPATV